MTKVPNSSVDLSKVVSRDPEVHSGDLVFAGTRVPVDTLIDYLKGGEPVDRFLADFPTVERWQVEAFLDSSSEGVEQLQLEEQLRDVRAGVATRIFADSRSSGAGSA